MKKYLLIVLLSGSLFASNSSENSVKVLNQTTVGINGRKYDNYIVQTICKDNYQYTVVIREESISITQDFTGYSNTSTDPRITICK